MRQLIINSLGRNKVSTKRRIRKNQILNVLRARGTLSYTEIARITQFSLPMVSDLTRELLDEGFVLPVTPELSKVGRPPNELKLNPDAGYILGIDVGHISTEFVLINLANDVLYTSDDPTINIQNESDIIASLVIKIKAIMKETHLSEEKLFGIGVAIPGLVNSNAGNSYTYLNTKDTTTQQILESHFKKPVRIENDVKAMALGEIGFGQAKNVTDAACINLGWGIGLALILNGTIHYGKSGFSGEFGHINIIEDGLLCSCGKRGCLETVASGRAIGEIARHLLKNGAESRIKSGLESLDEVDEKSIVEHARKGDQFCIEILQQAGNYIGRSIAVLINLLNPELIILGGKGSAARELILHPIRTAAVKYSLVELGLDAKIVCSELGDMAGCLGATTLITKEIFETSHLDLQMYV